MKNEIRSGFVGCAVVILSCLAYVACDDSSSAVKEPTPDAGGRGGPDSGTPRNDSGIDFDAGTLPDGAPKDCFDNPTTHFEIINACTTATKITKNPTLPKLLPDGGLPPLN
jgi:hypothetical protein